jgi:VanZ family protein
MSVLSQTPSRSVSEVGLAGVRNGGAVVADVAYSILVGVGLIWVGRAGTVVDALIDAVRVVDTKGNGSVIGDDRGATVA